MKRCSRSLNSPESLLTQPSPRSAVSKIDRDLSVEIAAAVVVALAAGAQAVRTES